MQALQIDEWCGPLHRRTLEEPVVGPGQLRLKVLACGVGLTVVNASDGLLAGEGRASLPRVPGHEICGEVVEIGGGVHGFSVGDRVVTYFYLSCGACRFCRTDRVPLCDRFRGFLGVDVDGGYAEQVVVEAFNALLVPPELEQVAATTIPDAVATPVHVCASRARIRPGETVLIIGAGGGVGIHMVQVARLLGGRVAAVDVSDEKLALAERLGAAVTIAAGASVGETEGELDGSADVVIDLVGTQATLDYALGCAGRGSRVVMLTTFPDGGVTLRARHAVLEEISVMGSKYASVAEVRRAVDLVARGLVKPVVTALTGLDGVGELHGMLRSRDLAGRAALVPGMSSSIQPREAP